MVRLGPDDVCSLLRVDKIDVQLQQISQAQGKKALVQFCSSKCMYMYLCTCIYGQARKKQKELCRGKSKTKVELFRIFCCYFPREVYLFSFTLLDDK